jgi:hypothetical protein
MVLVTGNWKLWLVAMAASLAIFAVVFFTVIKPSSDTANQALKSGLQQSQQVLNQAQEQITSAGGAGSSVTKQAKQAKQALSKGSKLTSCVVAAGTDPSKLEACQSKYAGS